MGCLVKRLLGDGSDWLYVVGLNCLSTTKVIKPESAPYLKPRVIGDMERIG